MKYFYFEYTMTDCTSLNIEYFPNYIFKKYLDMNFMTNVSILSNLNKNIFTE